MRNIWQGFILSIGLVTLLHCRCCSDSSDAAVSGGLVGENGAVVTSVDTTDPVSLYLDNLEANSQYTITVTDPNGEALSPDGGFIATSDEDGSIPTSTILQDLGSIDSDGSDFVLYSTGLAARLPADEGDYQIVVTDENGDEVFSTTFGAIDSSKVFCSDSSGTARASFTPSESVSVTIDQGEDEIADGTYTCYASGDLNEEITDQATLTGTQVVVTVAGGTGTASLGSFASGQYDVVCDLDADGLYDAGDDLLARPGRFHPCFTIQGANSGTDIIGQICADRHGNYRDVFDPNSSDQDIRDVFAWISPAEQSLVQHTIGVRKYIVPHQSSWTDGETLTDVDSAYEVDSVQGFCTNEAPWLVWPRQRLQAGCYDCIIDVNADGNYDTATDFVDNIDNTGDNSVGGFCVTDSECADFITISSHSDGDSVTDTAITLEGTIEEAATSAKVIVTAGASSNTINLTLSDTAFSATLPLFGGKNLITVVVTKADGSLCSKTIAVTQESTASDSEVFRVQMVWDGDTDMDLHLVRPEGAYSNGGGGADDCNYSNCKVGLDGLEGTGDSGENHTIDWGTASVSSDDPFLDVDCISCGNGIENVWMNGINDDGAYKIYIDAYSGTETTTQVSVFIRGVSVGTVTCNDLSAGTATDTCYVGYINWEGGTDGSGSFTAVGTPAADY